MKKYFLTFHTVFILRENIRWLDEFIQYYLLMGFEHFYLYDNTGSIGYSGSNENENKYGIKFDQISREDAEKQFNILLERYPNQVTRIIWQPRDNKNNAIYGQVESIKHFVINYGKLSEWTAFFDLDEFIFSPTDRNLVQYLKNIPFNCSCLKFVQKKFIDRFLSDEQHITQDFRCIDLEVETNWGPKNIIRPNTFRSATNIHNILCMGKMVVVNRNIFRFNHYNVNEKQLEWMRSFYKKEFVINGIDEGMKRYSHILVKQVSEKNPSNKSNVTKTIEPQVQQNATNYG